MDAPVILLTNDDGISAPGLRVLANALAPLGRVIVYAPDRQRSAVGHGVSLHQPLRVVELKPDWHMVDGTPADCLILAVRGLLGFRPNLIVSGINSGANLGDDVTYSGTVAGAFEGMLLGVPSFAISNIQHRPNHLDTAGCVARQIAEVILQKGLPDNVFLNVNLPDIPYDSLRGMAVTCMGRRNYQDEIIKRKDPRGDVYYWIGGANPDHYTTPDSDFEAIENNKVSITPLSRDLTAHAVSDQLKETMPNLV